MSVKLDSVYIYSYKPQVGLVSTLFKPTRTQICSLNRIPAFCCFLELEP
jgi:hypothetical protein